MLLEVGGWEENAEFIGPIFLLAYLNPARLRLGFFCMGMGIGHDYHFVSPGDCFFGRNC